MGLDAKSTDLTARIQRRRAALVAAGEVDPARPGEHRAFRGQPGTAPPREIPTRGAHRKVVPLDESPERGGADAEPVYIEDGEDTYLGSQEEKDAIENEVTESGVNEFGEKFEPDDDGGFDLGEAGQPYDPERDPELASPEAALQAKQMADGGTTQQSLAIHNQAKRRTALTALDAYVLEFRGDFREIIREVKERLDRIEQGLEPVLDFVADTSLLERMVAIEEGMLLLAEAVAQQGKSDVPGTQPYASPFEWPDAGQVSLDDVDIEKRPGLFSRLFLR